MGQPTVYPLRSVKKAITDLNLDARIDITFIKILDYLIKYHDTKSIIIEDNYIDRDFSNELSNFYSKTFRSRYGYCQRLHFIKESFSDEDDFLNRFNNNDITYLGYIVRRPLEVGKVGRTLILPKNFDNFLSFMSH